MTGGKLRAGRDAEIDDECTRFGVTDDVRHLIDREMPIDGGETEAGPPAPRPHLDEFRPVPAHECDGVARDQPEGAEGPRHLVGAGVELSEGAIAVG